MARFASTIDTGTYTNFRPFDPRVTSIVVVRQPQAKINAVHKQATLGDCCADTTECVTPFDKTVTTMWRGFKGTPAATAKRRYIALLRDVDPCLLQVKAYQVTPWGFPTTAKGERICPYSNAKKGCPRPLVDKHGHSLELELDTKESLANFCLLYTSPSPRD